MAIFTPVGTHYIVLGISYNTCDAMRQNGVIIPGKMAERRGKNQYSPEIPAAAAAGISIPASYFKPCNLFVFFLSAITCDLPDHILHARINFFVQIMYREKGYMAYPFQSPRESYILFVSLSRSRDLLKIKNKLMGKIWILRV